MSGTEETLHHVHHGIGQRNRFRRWLGFITLLTRVGEIMGSDAARCRNPSSEYKKGTFLTHVYYSLALVDSIVRFENPLHASFHWFKRSRFLSAEERKEASWSILSEPDFGRFHSRLFSANDRTGSLFTAYRERRVRETRWPEVKQHACYVKGKRMTSLVFASILHYKDLCFLLFFSKEQLNLPLRCDSADMLTPQPDQRIYMEFTRSAIWEVKSAHFQNQVCVCVSVCMR